MPPTLIVASMLPGQGPSGVETHANAIVEQARGAGLAAEFVSAQTHKDWRRRLQGVRRRVAACFGGEGALRIEREADAALLERRLRRAIERAGGSPLTIYAQEPISARAALRARAGLGAQSVRVVLTVHFNVSEAQEYAERRLTTPGGPLWSDVQALEREVLPGVDRLIFVSAFMREVVLGRLACLPADKVSLIPNFCPQPASASASAQPGLARIAGDLLAIGTLEPRKNQQFLLEVLSACNRKGRRYRCTIVGHGPDEAFLRRRADELGVADQVRFLGHRPHAAQLIPSHRVLVHGARMENLPLTLIEAFACGRPVLAGAVGGVGEVLRHGVEGFHWPLDDAEAAAGTLIDLLESPGLWERMAGAALSRYEECFSPSVLAPRWLAAIMGRAA